MWLFWFKGVVHLADTQLDYFKDVDVVLDYADQNISQKIFAAEGDIQGRTLTVQVTNKGRVSEIIGAELRAVWTNEATGISDITAFDEIDSSNGLFELTYPSHMMTKGNVKMQIQVLYQDASTLTRPFNITVTGINGDFRAFPEQQSFGILMQALNQAKKAGPIDTVDSYSELISRYPSGTYGTVLVLDDDGTYHSWLYKDRVWSDFGTYQEKGIADDSIKNSMLKNTVVTPIKTNFIDQKNQNLLSGSYSVINGQNFDANKIVMTPNQNGNKMLVIKITPGTYYINQKYKSFNLIAATSATLLDSTQSKSYDALDYLRMRFNNKLNTNKITTSSTAQYLYLWVYNDVNDAQYTLDTIVNNMTISKDAVTSYSLAKEIKARNENMEYGSISGAKLTQNTVDEKAVSFIETPKSIYPLNYLNAYVLGGNIVSDTDNLSVVYEIDPTQTYYFKQLKKSTFLTIATMNDLITENGTYAAIEYVSLRSNGTDYTDSFKPSKSAKYMYVWIYNVKNDAQYTFDEVLASMTVSLAKVGTYKLADNIEVSNVSKKYLPYESEAIRFTVDVNQNFADTTNTANSVQDGETFKQTYAALYLPKTYTTTGKQTPLAICAHGAGGLMTATSAGELATIASVFTDAGYAVFDINGSNNDYTEHADHMGSPRAIQAYLKAYNYIIENYNVDKRLFVHGGSMGGLTMLNFTNQNRDIVRCLSLFFPVTDLYNQAWLKPWFGTTRKQIAIEYNFNDKTGATYEADKVVGYNPILANSVTIADKQYKFWNIPTKIQHGTADNTVLLSGSQAIAQAIKNAGGVVDLRILDGVGHANNSVMNQEMILFMNRYK